MIISPSIESYFVGLGVNLQYPFNARLLMSYFVFISGTFSGFVELFHVAETIQEYAQSYFATAAVTAAGLSFAIVASKIQKLSVFIHDLENIMQRREFAFHTIISNQIKSNSIAMMNGISGRKYPTSLVIYDENFEIIKKWDGWVNLFVMRISLHGAMWSKYLASFAIYFLTDLGRDSFALPFPMW